MAKHLRITGLVQGVGYRASFAMQARVLALSGWVRNCRDGAVEACVAGDAQALEQLLAWAGHGPAGAQVQRVAVTEADDTPVADGGFSIWPTA